MTVYYRLMRYKDENKKEAIYKATILLLNSEGFSSTSMSKIAKHAGVSPSTIYIYFENKDDMLKKLYLDTKEKMSKRMFSGTDEKNDVKDNFEKLIRNYIDFIKDNEEPFLFLQQFTNSPYMSEVASTSGSSYFTPMYDLVRRGKDEGKIKNVSDDLLLSHIETPITELAKHYFRKEFEFTNKNIDDLITMGWDAIKK